MTRKVEQEGCCLEVKRRGGEGVEGWVEMRYSQVG